MPWRQGLTHLGSLMHRNRKYKVNDMCYFPWPPVVTAYDRKKLTRALNSSENYCHLYLEFSFAHQILPFTSNCAVDDSISKSPLLFNKPRRLHVPIFQKFRDPTPHGAPRLYSDCFTLTHSIKLKDRFLKVLVYIQNRLSSVTTSLLQLLKGTEHVQKMIDG